MPRLSANLGFLWSELSLPDAIRAAKNAGFEAVECHWPYDVPAADVLNALQETGLTMVSLNTRAGNPSANECGISAIPGREEEAKQYIDEAIDYASKINCPNIHVMAGLTGGGDQAEITFRDNLQYACIQARRHNKTVLIEPMNKIVVPNYHLATLEQAVSTVKAVDRFNLKIMFDCYHLQIMGGNLAHRLRQHLSFIGHIQFANVPNRSAPDEGEVNYNWLLKEIDKIGWEGFVGAEYKPTTTTDDSLSWMRTKD